MKVGQPITAEMEREMIEPDNWAGCYEGGWKGLIVDAAFAHPAKFSRNLIFRIIKHLLEEGALKPGDVVLDPFGGQAGGGLPCMENGLHYVGVELEPKFVEVGQGSDCSGISQANFIRFYGRWDKGSRPGERHFCPDCLTQAAAILDEREDKPKSQAQAHRRKRIAALAKKRGKQIPAYSALPLPGTQAAPLALSFATADPGASYRRNSGKIPQTQAHRYHGNIERWKQMFPHLTGSAVLLQGDSRYLGEIVRGAVGVVGSPPFTDQVPQQDKSFTTPHDSLNRKMGDYGSTPGQLAALPPGSVDSIVASPPFAGNTGGRGEASRNGIDAALFDRHGGGMKGGTGDDPANLDNLPLGKPPTAIIGSPPFAGSVGSDDPARRGGLLRDDPKRAGDVNLTESYGETPGQLGRMAVVGSPPFSINGNNPAGRHQSVRADYGKYADNPEATGFDTPGQLASLPPGSVDAVIGSPPFAGNTGGRGEASRNGIDAALFDRHGGGMKGGTGDDPANLDNLPLGKPPTAIIGSPPFAGSVGSDDPARRGGLLRDDPKRAGDVNLTGSYGETPGQLGRMAVVGSPPFEKQKPVDDTEFFRRHRMEIGRNPYTNGGTPLDYGSSLNQLGNETGETFWTAARLIVEQCAALLPPGGWAVWVLKAYVKDGAIVDFPGQWRQLCEACGFETVHEHRAMLVKRNGKQRTIANGYDTSASMTNLLGDDVAKEGTTLANKSLDVERYSFFRRLHIKKNPHLTIEWETVLCTRKRGNA